ncbi:siderophore-interacting protein [Paracoccus ravus]|uniref:siderophore-interacting protein n=1 Tax=Paracoccus ravus TaxID=2447760 RepID=UPI00106E2A7F|nr:siderophore-interacting protein [Paracoccus ravus]
MAVRHAARIGLPLDRVGRMLGEEAAEMGLDLQTTPSGFLMDLGDSRLSLAAAADGCALVLEAETDARLAELREAVMHFATEHHQPPLHLDWEIRPQPASPAKLTIAEVMSNRVLSPSFRRLRLAGDFARFGAGGMHFRLIFGPEGAGLPHADENGAMVWPGGVDRWHRPPYTVRSIAADCQWIDVDIFLHEGGRVTDWVRETQPGDRVALTGPGGKTPQSAEWIAYIGDETALPIIARALEILPADTQGIARIVVADLADRQPIRHPEGVDLQWLLRSETSTLAALQSIAPPETGRYVFFAAERQDSMAARDWLVARGFQRSEFTNAHYWTQGWEPPADQARPRRQAGGAASPAR